MAFSNIPIPSGPASTQLPLFELSDESKGMNHFQYVTQALKEQDLKPSKRYVYRCGNCKHVWAYEYILFEGVYYRPTPVYLFDMAQDQQRCPACSARRVRGGEIKSTVSSRSCTSSCLEASTEICHCSCGGANHAKGRLR